MRESERKGGRAGGGIYSMCEIDRLMGRGRRRERERDRETGTSRGVCALLLWLKKDHHKGKMAAK